MNKEIELHDSTFSEIKQKEDDIILVFDTAIVHHSDGQPGIDNGTCWEQKIEIQFKNSVIKVRPKQIPVEIAEGCLTVNAQEFNNMFSTSFLYCRQYNL